ncbi:MAG: hypothetical protein ACMG6H_12855, partial [Acidobacteriota bacterium]
MGPPAWSGNLDWRGHSCTAEGHARHSPVAEPTRAGGVHGPHARRAAASDLPVIGLLKAMGV